MKLGKQRRNMIMMINDDDDTFLGTTWTLSQRLVGSKLKVRVGTHATLALLQDIITIPIKEKIFSLLRYYVGLFSYFPKFAFREKSRKQSNAKQYFVRMMVMTYHARYK
jgi:hypothetical protein